MSATISAGTATTSVRADAPRLLADVIATFLDRHRHFFFIGLLVAYLLGFNGQWQLEPDSALYLTLGRNIAWGRGYTYHGLPHDLAYPGLPYALAAIFKIFHSQVHALFAADAFILLCGLAGLGLTYRLIYLAYDRPTAVVVTLGVGICHEYFRYCFEIMTDIPFVTGVMALLAGHEALFARHLPATRRRWWDWALLVGGLAIIITTRPTMIGLVAVWLAALIGAAFCQGVVRRTVFIGLGLAAVAIALFVLWDPRHAGMQQIGSYEHHALSLLTGDYFVQLRGQVWLNLQNLFGQSASVVRAMFGAPLGPWWRINTFFGVLILGSGIALMRKRMLWGLWVAATVFMVLFMVSHDRYMVEILPLLVLAWWRMAVGLERLLPPKVGRIVLAVLIGYGPLYNTATDIGVVIHQHRRPFLNDYKQGRFPPYVSMAQNIHELAMPDEVVLCPTKLSRILTFLSDRTVVEQVADDGLNYSQHRLLVIIDLADPDYSQWLVQKHVILQGGAIAQTGRGLNSKAAPLLLFHARIE